MAQEDGPRVIKAKTKKGQRALERRAPKAVEDAKRVLVLQGNKSSQLVKNVLTDVCKLKKQDAAKFTRNHSKKRPHNMVLGRMYNYQLLDMIELGIVRFEPVCQFKGSASIDLGSTPCFVFIGEKFVSSPEYKTAKSLLLDTFRGQPLGSTILLQAVKHVVVVTAEENKQLAIRRYAILLKKSGTQVPRVVLDEAGPRLDLEVRRCQQAPMELLRDALKQPQQLGKSKGKNIGFDGLEGRVGRVYLPKQDLQRVAFIKTKGTKRERREAAATRKQKVSKRGGDAAAATG